MADKRISQLVERTDIANNDVLPIVSSGATTTNKVTVSTLQDWMQENLDVGVTSVGLSMPSAFTVTNSPVTTSGNISVAGAGTVSQYIRGDGSLADFPSISGGGSSVSYYLNGSVSQGTIGGIAYRELNKVPILGTGTDFVAIADGYLASFITDAGDPSLLLIPGGNWNFETYFSASSGGGTPTFYVELYKVDSGGTATLIASNSTAPELIAFGTTITPYFSTLAVPTTTLTLTDRLAIRYYVARSGRTITLHTENGHLCQIITTFTTGLTALNGLTAQVQNLATGTSGSDFNIVSSGTTHTFNLPDASASNRGVVTTGTQTFAGYKIFNGTIGANVDIQLATVGTALNTFLKNINSTGLTSIGSNGFGFNNANNIYFSGSNKGGGVFAFSNSGTQTYTLQNASGTLAFTSDLGGYLPLTGGTLTGALNGTSAIFSGDLQSGTRLIAAASSQSIILTPNSGGSTNRVESVGTLPLALVSAAAITMAAGGVTPQITLATTGAATFTSSVTATRFNLASGSFSYSSFWGPIITGGSGTYSNFALLDPATNGIMWNPIGTLNMAFGGSGTFASSVTANELFIANSSILANYVGVEHRYLGTTYGYSKASANDGELRHYIGPSSGWGGKMTFYTDNTERMRITSSGNIGIGTASPDSKLSVFGTFRNYLPSGAGGQTLLSAISGVSNGYLINVDTSNNITHTWHTGGNVVSMNINSSGNVGIGTASPSARLHVSGDIHIGDYGTAALRILDLRSSNSIFTIQTDGTSGSLGTNISYSWANGGQGPLRFSNASGEVIRLSGSGNLLVGKTSDDGSRLQVNGIISQNNYTYHGNNDGGNLNGSTLITTGITLPANHLGSYEVYVNGNENGQNQCTRIYNVFYNIYTGWGAALVSTSYIGNDYGWVDLSVTSGGTLRVKAANNVSTGIYRIVVTKQFKN